VSVVNIVRLLAVTFLRNKLITTGIVTLFRVVKIHFSKNIGQLAVYVKQILSVFTLGTFCNAVACIVILIFFNRNIVSALNSRTNKAVFCIVNIKCRFWGRCHSYGVAVKVILVNNVILAHKLVKCIISVNSFFTVYGFQDSVAYVVISIGINSGFFALGDSFRGQTVQGIIAILHSAVKLSHRLALACCAESINILYYNIILVVNSFFTNKSVEQVIFICGSKTIGIMNSGAVSVCIILINGCITIAVNYSCKSVK